MVLEKKTKTSVKMLHLKRVEFIMGILTTSAVRILSDNQFYIFRDI